MAWPHEDSGDGGLNGIESGMLESMDKPFKPLSGVVPISKGIINPYRLLIVVRLVSMGLCLLWRGKNPNEDAYLLWLISVVCEFWLALSWCLDIIPKFNPINRFTDLEALKERFELHSSSHPTRRSDLPGIDLFVTTTDPEKESVLVTANAILSCLAVDYPIEQITCYVSDDGGSLLTFEAMVEAASFAELWVPFCKKHDIEPRDPEVYFTLKAYLSKSNVKYDFAEDRRKIRREYDEFKVRINGLPDSIRRRSNTFNANEEMKMMKPIRESGEDGFNPIRVEKATWMKDGTQWAGTWIVPSNEHARGDHASILKVILKPSPPDPLMGTTGEKLIDFSDTDIRLPMFVYISREKQPGYNHNKKAGAMNALARASGVLSNGPFILNLDCDHYFHNSKAIREGMCFMLDQGAEDICYIQFPQRFYGVDPSDRYANRSYVFYESSMRAYDGIQGPYYVGTGTIFRRFALYGFEPPNPHNHKDPETQASKPPYLDVKLMCKRFGNSTLLAESISIAEYQGRPLADHITVKYGRPPGTLRTPHEPLDSSLVDEAFSVISCCFEEKTEWGDRFGWIYGSATEDVVTGYSLHNRGWRSVFCIPKRDAFRGLAPINLTDRLHQILRWATGSLDIFFSKNCSLIASRNLKFMQRLVYINIGVYPFTSFFVIMYCFIPAYSLFSGEFSVKTPSIIFSVYLLIYTLSSVFLCILELKWSGIELEDWWRNEQFWVICCCSSYIASCVQVLLRLLTGIKISFPVTTKPSADCEDDDFAELYQVKWTPLMILPIVIGVVNIAAICYSLAVTMHSPVPSWGRFLGGASLSFWVLAHFCPFAKGLMGKRRKTSTLVYIWSGMIATIVYLLYIAIKQQTNTNPLQLQVVQDLLSLDISYYVENYIKHSLS